MLYLRYSQSVLRSKFSRLFDMYKIPDNYFFRLHHVRPRFKDDVEEVLLYVSNSISELQNAPSGLFKAVLNSSIKKFKDNSSKKQKTIDNWRTEISAIFSLIDDHEGRSSATLMAKRLSKNQYLDEFFNYFLFTFQYPGGHIKPQSVVEQIKAGIAFKPCLFILNLLIEGSQQIGKDFSITAEELTQCAFYDLRVIRDKKSASSVASQIIYNRSENIEYDHEYEQLKTKQGNFPSKGDVYRYASDILDYMVLANLLVHKGTGYYYYLNKDATQTIEYHINNPYWFTGYDSFYGLEDIALSEVREIEHEWVNYVNSYDNVSEFEPSLSEVEYDSIKAILEEYYANVLEKPFKNTKIIGDYGESLILAYELKRTKAFSDRQHIIKHIPTSFAVGYDIQSINKRGKRYIEVKTTKSKKALSLSGFKLTPNEWDTAVSVGDAYYVYFLVANEFSKKVFIINNPVKQHKLGNIKVDKFSHYVEFKSRAGAWHDLI